MTTKRNAKWHTIGLLLTLIFSAGVEGAAQPLFVDVTGQVGLGDGGHAAWGDYDGDGWVDVCINGSVYRNDNSERFTMVHSGGGPGIWGDCDNDGDLDRFCWEGVGKLYLNNGDGTFSDATAGLPPLPTVISLGACWADLDEDGDVDVYVSNYRLQPNLLWRNDGNMVFTDVADEYGVASGGHTIGSAWGDLDDDGHIDLFVGNFSHSGQPPPKFLRNQGPPEYHFEDMSSGAGLQWQESFASSALGAFDNDGDLDLYFTTVYGGDHCVLYQNDGQWHFTDVTAQAGIQADQTYQAAWADYDNGGDLDLLTDGKLYENRGATGHWLKVRLEGPGSAIGAQVRIPVGGRIITRQVEGGTGEGNQNDLTLHFGLGDHSDPVAIEITWPDGTVTHAWSPVDRLFTGGGPIITIINPLHNSTTFLQQVAIVATIQPYSDINETSIQLEIDGSSVTGFAYAAGTLTYDATLAAGLHEVIVRAEDNAANELEAISNFRILEKSFDVGLHLLSLPYTYGPGEFPTPDSLFGLSPGNVAMHRWWPGDNNANKYRTYPDNYGTFNPPDAMGGNPIVESPPAGLGYFINLPQQATVQEPGTVLDGGVTTYEIDLTRGLVPPRGWHMIGCPFSQALDWGSVEFVTDGQAQSITEAVEDGVTDGILWEFVSTGSGGYYDFPYDPLSATLEPFKGYWVHVWEDTTLRLDALLLGGAGVTSADSSGNFESDDEWQLQIIASAGGDVDPCNYIGVTSAATSGYDPGLDVTEPPSVGGAVQCYQPRADWDEYSGNYARDIRSTVAGSQTWDVEVSCQLSGEPVTVRWPELNSVVPGAVKLMLEDVDTGHQVYMRTSSGYSFTSPEGGGVRHLRITVYDDTATSLTLTGVSAQATGASGAVITYRVSKPATVSAEICNISGVVIRRLAEQTSAAGQVEMILWDGRSGPGTKVPAGRYLARITAQANDGQTVQAVRPVTIIP